MSAARPTESPTFDDEKLYLVARVADDIAPHLAERPQDRGMASQMAWRIVQSYEPESEAEVLNAARIVNLSLTQLDLLRASAGTNLTPSLKLRLISAVLGLNRSITHAERALARLQRTEDVRRPAPPKPRAVAPKPEPDQKPAAEPLSRPVADPVDPPPPRKPAPPAKPGRFDPVVDFRRCVANAHKHHHNRNGARLAAVPDAQTQRQPPTAPPPPA